MTSLFGLLAMTMVVVIPIAALSAPLILITFVVRKRLPSAILRLLLASGLAIAAIYRMWRMWWFDIVRDSGPPVSYIVTTIVPFAAVFAIVGWLLAWYITRHHALHPTA
jgi:hypothetical protein